VKLSVVIITYNEEKNIERCILSVKEIADDIVVVDSFSTDRTEEICLGHGVRFLKHSFEGYIEQKNWAKEQAMYDFVLSLDADEALSDELRDSISKVDSNPSAEGYYFNRLTNYCGQWIRHCGWYPDRKLRLWDRRRGSWQGVNPHDEFFLDEGCRKQYLKGDLLHYSFYTVDQHIAQINKFSSIKAQGMFERGIKPGLLRMWVSPGFKFFRDYFLKLGFLDGYFGYLVCRNSAYSTFLKYAKLKSLYKMKASQS
jgi:glycosyltransferase involved in cell wall biosynthesis